MRTYSKRVAAAAVIVAGAAAVPAAAVPPPPDGSFSGETAQANLEDNGVEFATDPGGRVSQFRIGWRAKCKRKGISWTTVTVIQPRSGGLAMQGDVFGADGSYTGHAGRKTKGKVTVSLRGQFNDNDNASGTWSAKVTVFKKKRGKFRKHDKCSVSTTWTAQREQ